MSKKKKPYGDDVKFLHYRAYEEIPTGDGDAREQIASHGGSTVAYVEGEEGISFAFAHCHELDRYNKELGRIKSAGRLLSDKYSASEKLSRDAFIRTLDNHMAQRYLFRRSQPETLVH